MLSVAYAEFFIVILNDVTLSVNMASFVYAQFYFLIVILNAFMLSVIMVNVIYAKLLIFY